MSFVLVVKVVNVQPSATTASNTQSRALTVSFVHIVTTPFIGRLFGSRIVDSMNAVTYQSCKMNGRFILVTMVVNAPILEGQSCLLSSIVMVFMVLDYPSASALAEEIVSSS